MWPFKNKYICIFDYTIRKKDIKDFLIDYEFGTVHITLNCGIVINASSCDCNRDYVLKEINIFKKLLTEI